MKRLFQRSLDGEPAEELARHLHRRFQLANAESETVKRLGRFPTPVLRELADRVAPYLGPPFPEWMYDPLGYLAAKAREIFEARERRFHDARLAEETEKRRKEEQRAEEEALEAQRRERERSPERFVDETLGTLLRGIQARLPTVVRSFTAKLEELLGALARQLGHAFADEVTRLRQKALALASSERVRQEVEAILEGMVRRVEAIPC
ncbi:MAG: hypothetical protein ACE5G2_13900 [Candidatus Krumholzibacteriia bacterium]